MRCIWSLTGTGSSAAQTIVPDGCAEILLNCADPVVQCLANGRVATQPRITLVGEVRRPVTISEGVVVDMVGIRIMPGALGMLFDEPPGRLVDGTIDIDLVLPACERTALQTALGEENVQRRILLIEHWLLERVRRSKVDDRLVRRAVQTIEATHGLLSVEHLATDLTVHRRSLERAFKELVGISPKAFARVRRFQHVLRLIECGKPFADAAIATGYFDQAHLIGDFHAYAGRTPSAYLRASHDLNQLFGHASPQQPTAKEAVV